MPGLNRLATIPEMMGNSPFKEYPSPFMHGIVVFVDPERWTVTVQIHETGARQYNVPIMSPYFCRDKGQGAYFVPEVGSQCLVCYAYGQPFVLGFLPPVDIVSKGLENVDNLSEQAGTYKPPDENPDIPPITSYRNNRDGDMLPGDYCIRTAGKNRLKMFTNGNVLVEASKLCMRLYSKLKNWITDHCVNYTLNTPGGQVNFLNSEEDGSTQYKREIRHEIDDDAYCFVEKIGTEGEASNRTIFSIEWMGPFDLKPSGGELIKGTTLYGSYRDTKELDNILWIVSGDGYPAEVELTFTSGMKGIKSSRATVYGYYQILPPIGGGPAIIEDKYADVYAFNYNLGQYVMISDEDTRINAQTDTTVKLYSYDLDENYLDSEGAGKIKVVGSTPDNRSLLGIDFAQLFYLVPPGTPVMAEQLNLDGSVEIDAMLGGHKIIMDRDRIEISTKLAGINSMVITTNGIVVSTNEKIALTGPGGTLTIAPDLSTWEVLGNLAITVTGDATIDSVGTLSLNPTPPFPYRPEDVYGPGSG